MFVPQQEKTHGRRGKCREPDLTHVEAKKGRHNGLLLFHAFLLATHSVCYEWVTHVYWMHLEATSSTTLATLDRFLWDTWLKCCGHLSAFTIGAYELMLANRL